MVNALHLGEKKKKNLYKETINFQEIKIDFPTPCSPAPQEMSYDGNLNCSFIALHHLDTEWIGNDSVDDTTPNNLTYWFIYNSFQGSHLLLWKIL